MYKAGRDSKTKLIGSCGDRFTGLSSLLRALYLVSCVLFLTASAAANEQITAIQGGSLYTITSGIIKNGTILIKDGKIWDVGQNIEIPEGAKVIDAKGKIVMPGLIAASADMGIGPFGSTDKIADSLDPFHYNISMALAAGITTAFVSRGGPSGEKPIGGTNAIIKSTYGDLDNMLVKESVAENISISSSEWLRKTNFLQNLQKVRTYLRKLAEYQKIKSKNAKAEEPKKPSGIDAYSSYVRLLKRESPARMRAVTADEILAALEIMDEFNIRIIMEDAVEAWIVADEIAERGVLLIITPRQERRPDENISGPSGSTLESAAILKKAGIKFAIVPPGKYFATWGGIGEDLLTMPMEAAFAVQGGLDEQTALEAMTINAAEILGIADRVGSLQIGKDADIIILDGHPLHHSSFVELTLVNGKILYDKEKSTYFSHIK